MNKKKTSWGVAILAIIIAPLTMAAACPGDTQTSGQDPDPANIKPAKVIDAYQLPDGFRNVVEFCDGAGNSHAVTSRGSDFAGGPNGGGVSSGGWLVMLKDPRCGQ